MGSPQFNGEKSDGSHFHLRLYKCNEKTPFLKQVVTGDEKWIIYNNVERKRSWGKRNKPPLAIQKPVFIQRRSCSMSGGIGK